MKKNNLRLFFLIFTASGFAGIIYESIWTQYLKLFLGHAAYAQALVLAVFMGGMALGSLFCSKYSLRLGNLLLGYAVVEAAIGICAVLFHPLYVHFIDFAYTTFIPSLDSPLAVALFRWVAATLLILPQSILLGMTFPLMTAGLLRRFPQTPGSVVAMLYFTNSLGAGIGVLTAGFLFIGWVGLPGTLVIGGFINIIIAAIVWLEYKQNPILQPEPAPTSKTAVKIPIPARRYVYNIFVLIALMTGLSSFIYEIGWIRMLSLVLGSSTHAFELMLSAFILGIAFGGLWVKRRIDSLNDPRRFLAIVQVAMGLLALATLPLYGTSFSVMGWLIKNLPKTETGYFLFNLSSQGIALVIMLPAAFCAGMTLPLITTTLLRNGSGEKSIGAVYGFNTIGSILGVFIAVYLAMPQLGLKGTIILGSAIDILLGLSLAWWSFPSWRIPAVVTTISLVSLFLPTFWLNFDPVMMASGVYRFGLLPKNVKQESLYHRDGRTATVSVIKRSNSLEIKTNGKPDASIQVGGIGHSWDEDTMVMLGALGIILHPTSRTAAVIGWGSGLSTHVLLTSPNIKSVDTIEIEPEMVKAAALFGPRVHLAYDDPRNHLRIEDAKAYFSFNKQKYDIIISEPSNPWVSGVASLFTKEFYSRIREYLSEQGLFIQWLQLYEIDRPLLASIMNALSPYFSDYAIYATYAGDVIIVACPDGTIPEPNPVFLSMTDFTNELRRVDIMGIPDISVRMLGDKALFAPLFERYAITTNSDYAPVVDLYAVRSRFFEKEESSQLYSNEMLRLPIAQMLGRKPDHLSTSEVTYAANYPESQNIHFWAMQYQYLMNDHWKWDHPDIPVIEKMLPDAIIAREVLTRSCSENYLQQEWWKAMYNTTASIAAYATNEQLTALLQRIETPTCLKNYSVPQKDFILLLRAVGARDPALMTRYSVKLLNEMERNVVNVDLFEYILSAGILGNLSLGNMQDASLLWDKYGRLLPMKDAQSLPIQLLVAHLSDGQGKLSDLR
ncbi:MAG TPA: spermidine synthase [Nitrospirota bacterium]|nr:spermidine synthase [Nitrospirota bacterium]